MHLDSKIGTIPALDIKKAYQVLVDLLCGENHGESDEWDLVDIPCTQQKNDSDCGVHVILNSAALCDGDDPRDIRSLPITSLRKRIAVANLLLDHLRQPL